MSDKKAHVDYTASAAMTGRDFNVTLYDTTSYTSCAFGCISARDIPNNAGSLEPRMVSAPEPSGRRPCCRARRFRRRSGRQFDFFSLPNNV
jgi:N-methylhydantoinase B/oxoprolinase/acetone carboxylase alpha subunit